MPIATTTDIRSGKATQPAKAAPRWISSIFGSSRSIPSLDGLRAISVALVLFSHLCGSQNFPLPATSRVVGLGIFGVRVFFVISGYLITGILLSELSKTGGIDLKRFYFRRSLRLFPAAWMFITTAAILSRFGLLTLHPNDLFFAYTYSSNYYEGRSFAIGHLWTLAVEEQFYILWPIALKLLDKTRSRFFLFTLLLAAPFCRLLSKPFAPAFDFFMYSDSLGTGCLLALMQREFLQNKGYHKVLASRWMAVLPFVALAANYIPSTKVTWLVGETIQNVAIALCIHWCILNPKSGIGRFLNLSAISSIGVLSYSLYLWQQLFTHFGIHAAAAAFPLNLLMMFAAAICSFLFIEAPFLRLRQRLELRWWPKASLSTAVKPALTGLTVKS